MTRGQDTHAHNMNNNLTHQTTNSPPLPLPLISRLSFDATANSDSRLWNGGVVIVRARAARARGAVATDGGKPELHEPPLTIALVIALVHRPPQSLKVRPGLFWQGRTERGREKGERGDWGWLVLVQD